MTFFNMIKNIALTILCTVFSLSFSMDSQVKKRAAFVIGDPANDVPWYTFNHLADVLQKPHFECVEQNCARMGKKIDVSFQLHWYDRRQAALAADLMLKGISLKNNSENLIEDLPQLHWAKMKRMANVMAFGFLIQELPKLINGEKNKESKVFKSVLYYAALAGLKVAHDDGKNLIAVDDYVRAVNADIVNIHRGNRLFIYNRSR